MTTRKIISAILSLTVISSFFITPTVKAEEIPGWTTHYSGGATGSVTIDNKVYYSGNASLKMVNNSPKSANVYIRAITKVPLVKGKEYNVSGKVRSKRSSTLAFSLGWTKMYYITPFGSTYDWVNYEFSYIAPETKETEFFILAEGISDGVWLDDVKIIDPDTGENLVSNPGFEAETAAGETVNTPEDSGGNSLSDIYNSIRNSESFKEEDMEKVRGGFKYMPVYGADGITVDGDASDWESYPAISMPTLPTQYNIYLKDDAPRDVQAECRFAQDEENFYFVIEVTDNVHKYVSGEKEYWSGDSIQLVLSSVDEGYGSELGLAHNPQTEEGEIYGSGFDDEAKSKMTLKSSQNGKKTTYEVKIPWTTKFESRPEQMYFNFLINDNDGAGRRYCAELAPGISEGKTNAQFPLLEVLSSQKDWYAWVQVPRNSYTIDETVYESYIVNSGDEKTFVYENLTDGTKEEIVVPGGSGVRREIKRVYDSPGDFSVDVRFEANGEEYISTAKTTVTIKPPSKEEAEAVVDKLTIQAEELSELIEQCKNKGIPTDYELIDYRIIERFIRYVSEDINNNDLMRLDYTENATDELYKNTKESLESYLSGESKPKTVSRYVTSDVTIDGKSMLAKVETDGEIAERPVFFVGYGHFATAKNDLTNFDDFGVNSIQFEAGISQVMRRDDKWIVESFSGPDAKVDTTDTTSASGEKSLRIIYNSDMAANRYVTIYQNVDVVPGKTYVLSGMVKADNATNFWISPNNFAQTYYLSGTYDWKKFSYEYTMPEGITRATVRILVQNKATGIYFDDVSLKEKGTDTEIIQDGGFEELFTSEKYIFDSEGGYFRATLAYLKQAEENNVAVSFLLGPHYFLADYIEKHDMAASNGFLKFNVNHPAARDMVETWLRKIIPLIQDYECIKELCISNEPEFWTEQEQMREFYKDDWQGFLRNTYGNDINSLNAAYKTSYNEFNEVSLEADASIPAKTYDIKVFNDKMFSGWHKFMADIIREMWSDIPVHTKIMGYVSSSNERKKNMSNGTGYNYYSDIMDVNGCDYWNYLDDNFEPLVKEMWYDYMTSLKNVPVVNSEDHIIMDRNENFVPEVADYVSQDIYQGAIHGRSTSDIWVWDRSTDSKSDFRGSILYRPDAISKIGKAALDLNRLAYEITALQNENTEIGILYSDADMLNNPPAMHAAYEAYEASMFSGKRVKFITEVNTEAMHETKLLIVPYTLYVGENMLDNIRTYIENGGRVLIMGEDRLAMTERTIEHDRESVDYIINNSDVIPYSGTYNTMENMTKVEFCECVRNVLKEEGIYYVSVVDSITGKPVHEMEYNIGVYEGKLLVNLANFGEEKTVKVYAGNKLIDNLTELRSESAVGETVTVGKYESVTLEAEVGNVFVDTFGHWAEEEIAELAAAGIIKGRTESRFDPNGTITRWEFHALLSRAAGKELPGFSGADFRPDDKIKRIEMCEMLVDYYEAVKGDISVSEVPSFKDISNDIPSVAKAVSAGLMRGREDGTFDTAGTATRAEAATVIKRFL